MYFGDWQDLRNCVCNADKKKDANGNDTRRTAVKTELITIIQL